MRSSAPGRYLSAPRGDLRRFLPGGQCHAVRRSYAGGLPGWCVAGGNPRARPGARGAGDAGVDQEAVFDALGHSSSVWGPALTRHLHAAYEHSRTAMADLFAVAVPWRVRNVRKGPRVASDRSQFLNGYWPTGNG